MMKMDRTSVTSRLFDIFLKIYEVANGLKSLGIFRMEKLDAFKVLFFNLHTQCDAVVNNLYHVCIIKEVVQQHSTQQITRLMVLDTSKLLTDCGAM